VYAILRSRELKNLRRKNCENIPYLISQLLDFVTIIFDGLLFFKNNLGIKAIDKMEIR